MVGSDRRSLMEADLARFTRTLTVMAEQAVLRGKPLMIIIDVTEGYYTVYEADADGEPVDLDEPVLDPDVLDKSYIYEAELEDGTRQLSGELILYAGPQGWETSALFHLKGIFGRERWLRLDRLTVHVMTKNEPLFLPETFTELSIHRSL